MDKFESYNPAIQNSDGTILRITDAQYDTKEDALDYLTVYSSMKPLTTGQRAVLLTLSYDIHNEEPQPTLVGN